MGMESSLNSTLGMRLKAWLNLSRLPFHTVGILPVILGTVLAWCLVGQLDWIIFGWGLSAVTLIMLATYYAGEYFDYETDALSAQMERNRFSGGTQVLQVGIISRKQAFIAALFSLLAAGGIGILLQFHYRTGPWTIPLGAIGMLGGFFYTTKPIQWSYRGVGEAWIGFCYGWLPVAAAYYIQTGGLAPVIDWLALPIALTIFNVVLINEFPDYPADKQVGKRNLVVRCGKGRMSKLYASLNFAACILYLLLPLVGVPLGALTLFAPFGLLGLITALQVLRGDYKDRKRLEGICAKTLVFNLGTTLSLILAFVLW